MPKVGQEPARRAALVDATIREIGKVGSLDVTVGQIARRAGMSPALAHYYFDTKDAIFLAAMRHILSEFGRLIRLALAGADTPRARLSAVVETSLGKEQFKVEVISAWLVFYVQAQQSGEAARLLHIYAARLHSNLVHDLRQLVDLETADRIASGVGALIDGIYIRQALRSDAPDAEHATMLVQEYIDLMIANAAGK